MKIFTAMYTMRRGGAYDRFKMMMEAFLERECEVHCLSLTPIKVNHPRYQNHVLRIPPRMQETFVGKLVVLFLFPLYAVWIGRQEKVDLFIAFGTLYAFIEGIPKWILRKPMATFLRGNFAFGMRAQGRSGLFLWLSQWIEKVGIHFSDTILSVNSTIQEEMRRSAGGRKSQRWEILPNNIPPMPIPENQDISETRIKYGIPEGAKTLVTAGIINRGKNIELLIRSLPKIGFDYLHLYVVGDGLTEADFCYRNQLREIVKDLDISDRVIFTGWIEKKELWKLLRISDLFILPSQNEGMPNTLLEALAVNLPCFGCNIPGIKDVLYYDELMFDPEDGKALVDKIQQLFTDRQILEKVKRLCRERKEIFVFDWEKRVFEMITATVYQPCK